METQQQQPQSEEEVRIAFSTLKAHPGWARFRSWWEERRALALLEIRLVDPLEPADGQASGAHRIIRAQQVLDDFDAIFGDGSSNGLWEEAHLPASAPVGFTYNANYKDG